MPLSSVEEAQKRIVEIGGFSPVLQEVLLYLLKEQVVIKENAKRDGDAKKAELEQKTKELDERLEAETQR